MLRSSAQRQSLPPPRITVSVGPPEDGSTATAGGMGIQGGTPVLGHQSALGTYQQDPTTGDSGPSCTRKAFSGHSHRPTVGDKTRAWAKETAHILKETPEAASEVLGESDEGGKGL